MLVKWTKVVCFAWRKTDIFLFQLSAVSCFCWTASFLILNRIHRNGPGVGDFYRRPLWRWATSSHTWSQAGKSDEFSGKKTLRKRFWSGTTLTTSEFSVHFWKQQPLPKWFSIGKRPPLPKKCFGRWGFDLQPHVGWQGLFGSRWGTQLWWDDGFHWTFRCRTIIRRTNLRRWRFQNREFRTIYVHPEFL